MLAEICVGHLPPLAAFLEKNYSQLLFQMHYFCNWLEKHVSVNYYFQKYFVCLQLINTALPWQELASLHSNTARVLPDLPDSKALEGLAQQCLL